MGFDASEVMQELDASKALRELDARRYPIAPSHVASNILRQYQKTVLTPSVIDQLQRSSIGSLSVAGMHEALRPHTPHVLLLCRLLSGLAGNLAFSNYYARMQSDMLQQVRTLVYPGLSSSIAQAFEAHGLDSTYSAAWTLRRVQSFRTPALQSILKATTTFGPIVISPDDEDAPFDYHPNLQGWLIPETATESGDAIDVEELWAEVVAFAVGIAQHHHSKVLLRVLREDGRSILVQVASGLILYWLLLR